MTATRKESQCTISHLRANDSHPAFSAHNDNLCWASEAFIFSRDPSQWRPLTKSARNPRTSEQTHIELQQSSNELGRRVPEVQDSIARTLYGELSDKEQKERFLKTPQSGYDVELGQWKELSREPKNERDLRGHICRIVNAIIEHFHSSLPEGVGREAVDSHDIAMIHDNGKHFTKPGVCIKARGLSFEVPEHSGDLGYTNAAAVFDVKLDKAKGKRKVHCKRLSTYNRQIFIQQPNRHFSRSMLITEKVFRMVHLDRSGVYVTPLFDIHEEAALFVQFIIGLTSSNEQDIGLDTSVQWVIDSASGKKVSGTIKVDEYDEEAQTSTSKTYYLDMDQPPFVRPGFNSRGTVCWHAKDPVTGDGVIIKEAWRSDTRSSEVEYLLKARGIPGVVQMLGYQDSCASTSQYRPVGFDWDGFRNRIKLRLVLKKYRDSIWFFRSRLQLLYALRDAFVGHCQLFEKGVMHRDISMLNILLGLPGAPKGYRGVIIDLDMAAPTKDFKSTLPADPYTGTRVYQSIMALQGWPMVPAPPQDYTDELESIFYVYCHLLYAFKKPGVLLDDGPDVMEQWDSDDVESAANAKIAFILTATKAAYISPYWGETCVTLLRELHSIVRDCFREKDHIYTNKMDAEAKSKAFDELAKKFKVPFTKAKEAFEKAIAKLEKEDLNAEEREPYPKTFAPHFISSIPGASQVQGNEAAETRTPPVSIVGELPDPVLPNPADPPASKKRPSEDRDDDLPRKRLRETDADRSPAGCKSSKASEVSSPLDVESKDVDAPAAPDASSPNEISPVN